MLSWEEGARVSSQEVAFFHCKSSKHSDESERSLGLGTGLATESQMALMGKRIMLSPSECLSANRLYLQLLGFTMDQLSSPSGCSKVGRGQTFLFCRAGNPGSTEGKGNFGFGFNKTRIFNEDP